MDVENRERLAFAKRMNQALDVLGVPRKGKGRQQVVAKMFDVSQGSARKWLEGESFPGVERIPEFSRKLQARGEWLLTGAGEMTKESPEAPLDQRLLTVSIRLVDEALANQQVTIYHEKKAAMVSQVYKRAVRTGEVDAELARDLVELMQQTD